MINEKYYHFYQKIYEQKKMYFIYLLSVTNKAFIAIVLSFLVISYIKTDR